VGYQAGMLDSWDGLWACSSNRESGTKKVHITSLNFGKSLLFLNYGEIFMVD
jgi:hypothetical protein